MPGILVHAVVTFMICYIFKCIVLKTIRQVLGPGTLGKPRGIGYRGKWEGGSGWGIHVNPWLIHVNVWQKPLQYCKAISLQLKKRKRKKKYSTFSYYQQIYWPTSIYNVSPETKPPVFIWWFSKIFSQSKIIGLAFWYECYRLGAPRILWSDMPIHCNM